MYIGLEEEGDYVTWEEQQRLIHKVKAAVKEEPQLFKEIVMACNQSLVERIDDERRRSADMETVAVAFQALAGARVRKKTLHWAEDLIQSKLKKWEGNLSFNWTEEDDVTESTDGDIESKQGQDDTTSDVSPTGNARISRPEGS